MIQGKLQVSKQNLQNIEMVYFNFNICSVGQRALSETNVVKTSINCSFYKRGNISDDLLRTPAPALIVWKRYCFTRKVTNHLAMAVEKWQHLWYGSSGPTEFTSRRLLWRQKLRSAKMNFKCIDKTHPNIYWIVVRAKNDPWHDLSIFRAVFPNKLWSTQIDLGSHMQLNPPEVEYCFGSGSCIGGETFSGDYFQIFA